MPKKAEIHFQSRHESGNIYAVMAMVRDQMRKEHRITDWNNAWELIQKTDYAGALAVMRDLVDLVDDDGLYNDRFCTSEDGFEVEYCNVCEREIQLRWDINKDGFQAYCPVCGSRLMLCDACMHRYGEVCDDCDYGMYEDKTICRFRRPDDWWKEDNHGKEN